jgi:FKBP-type peptidyl-prolyl cis-trans isomerase FkpA
MEEGSLTVRHLAIGGHVAFFAHASRSILFLLPMVALLAGTAACTDNPSSPSSSPVYSQTDLVVGTGPQASLGNYVTVGYTGWLYDATKPDGKGTQFDSGTVSFSLGFGQVIAGWDQGVAGMRAGGRRRLVIPPDLAYGSSGAGPIPPNATLVFDVALLSLQ